MLKVSWVACVRFWSPSLSSECLFWCFFLPPRGDTWPLSVDCCVEHNIICWRLLFLHCMASVGIKPPETLAALVSLSHHAATQNRHLSPHILCWMGSRGAKRIDLTVLLNWSECFNFQTHCTRMSMLLTFSEHRNTRGVVFTVLVHTVVISSSCCVHLESYSHRQLFAHNAHVDT